MIDKNILKFERRISLWDSWIKRKMQRDKFKNSDNEQVDKAKDKINEYTENNDDKKMININF